MSQQSFFGTVSLNAASSAPIYVDLGFIPGKVELFDLTQIETPTNTNGYAAMWQQGMASGSAIITKYNAGLEGLTTYISSNGISLLNPLGSEMGQYGAVVSGFTNNSPGVITVDSTANAGITAGCLVRVSNVADSQVGPTLNGNYYVTSVTATTVTLAAAPAGYNSEGYVVNSPNTTGSGVYVSGGFVSVLINANATSPFPLNTVYSNVPQFYNQAMQGFIIGTGVFPNATYSLTTPDLILVSAWDMMQP